jgi:hypothetical protein
MTPSLTTAAIVSATWPLLAALSAWALAGAAGRKYAAAAKVAAHAARRSFFMIPTDTPKMAGRFARLLAFDDALPTHRRACCVAVMCHS